MRKVNKGSLLINTPSSHPNSINKQLKYDDEFILSKGNNLYAVILFYAVGIESELILIKAESCVYSFSWRFPYFFYRYY